MIYRWRSSRMNGSHIYFFYKTSGLFNSPTGATSGDGWCERGSGTGSGLSGFARTGLPLRTNLPLRRWTRGRSSVGRRRRQKRGRRRRGFSDLVSFLPLRKGCIGKGHPLRGWLIHRFLIGS